MCILEGQYFWRGKKREKKKEKKNLRYWVRFIRRCNDVPGTSEKEDGGGEKGGEGNLERIRIEPDGSGRVYDAGS